MPGQVIRQKWITRADVRSGKGTTIYVFGDNLSRTGYGGQAKEMRGERNAISVPTKWTHYRNTASYFSDDDFNNIKPSIDTAFSKIRLFLRQGFNVVIPADVLGTGLAELQQRAPKIHQYIEQKLVALIESAQ